MPAWAAAVVGIFGRGSFCPFCLTKKNQKVKADINGPNALSGRFPAMSAVARVPSPDEDWRSQPLLTTLSPYRHRKQVSAVSYVGRLYKLITNSRAFKNFPQQCIFIPIPI